MDGFSLTVHTNKTIFFDDLLHLACSMFPCYLLTESVANESLFHSTNSGSTPFN